MYHPCTNTAVHRGEQRSTRNALRPGESPLPGTQRSFGCGLIIRRSQVQLLPRTRACTAAAVGGCPMRPHRAGRPHGTTGTDCCWRLPTSVTGRAGLLAAAGRQPEGHASANERRALTSELASPLAPGHPVGSVVVLAMKTSHGAWWATSVVTAPSTRVSPWTRRLPTTMIVAWSRWALSHNAVAGSETPSWRRTQRVLRTSPTPTS